ncbi:hypothetical protein KUTeg_013156 [Tegillarca granosa]|uniref:EF-hand domain-containing protein n=1 Tax=Tegillarca granosa TaxID=220873 RepID=A0ABQ9EWC4_TEGGR|nr:hypothetical protein KUTeg_013156 [Tegillarca granosa]
MMVKMVKKGENSGAKDELRAAFEVFDADKNGFVSAKELSEALTTKGTERMSIKEAEELIAAVDMDKDGQLNYEGKSVYPQTSAHY